jgi:hypothetical protein
MAGCRRRYRRSGAGGGADWSPSHIWGAIDDPVNHLDAVHEAVVLHAHLDLQLRWHAPTNKIPEVVDLHHGPEER